MTVPIIRSVVEGDLEAMRRIYEYDVLTRDHRHHRRQCQRGFSVGSQKRRVSPGGHAEKRGTEV